MKTGRTPRDMAPTAVEVNPGNLPDIGRIVELAVSLNRMRVQSEQWASTWTTVRVREMRQRLGIPEYDPGQS